MDLFKKDTENLFIRNRKVSIRKENITPRCNTIIL